MPISVGQDSPLRASPHLTLTPLATGGNSGSSACRTLATQESLPILPEWGIHPGLNQTNKTTKKIGSIGTEYEGVISMEAGPAREAAGRRDGGLSGSPGQGLPNEKHPDNSRYCICEGLTIDGRQPRYHEEKQQLSILYSDSLLNPC
ncbi:hypothetical protein An07g00210 [Aspergillus niger]|uniref:Uncharacterized protein n=2 Tax=Aspergillus niger TaxID=5061 RepID=A2QLZ1_ASPNC|nr:hypothetical protein An07g00210 [Aspergillus niger]CAK39245.1 hypothetical protein An07g00210 [Aspergillus niger]